ncbi:NADPH dehydrogenase NamA [Bacillus shivajii]|uniref:NADPH dehydrogenase NamA n=1 Tax=Bacillus shivajii TaxID=1983719 RepID=UPI001CFA8487|nr:NADPH dehydrogenase NamA [Bacillus shivajii]UCZ54648.1 NADPH dehydrogenase NamA [Bacillus shivajii]
METKLFTPISFKGVTLKNRIVMSPMCMYSSHDEDGKVTDWHFTHYISRAIGQVGLIMTEATPVTQQGQISPQDLGIWSDNHIEGLRKLIKGIKAYGAKTAIQLGHAGRKAIYDGEILAPSPIAFVDKLKVPKEMTKEDIERTIEAFKEGARRSKEAGFDMIEIHGAHGYLISQFLSPLSNKRTDEYGGSRENRFRFLKEIIERVNTVWDGPLFVRISADEYHKEGNKLNDFVYFTKELKELNVDLIDCSTGGIVRTPINVYPGYQLRHAETIKREANIATGAVGLITTGTQAEEILQNERADLVFIGRELLRDPYWPRTAAKELGVELEAPKQYRRSW